MNSKNPIVIIGTGLAGYMLAKELRKLDTKTPLTLITADDGTFYSKPLLSTALSYQRTPEQLAISTADVMALQLNATILTFAPVARIDTKAKCIEFADNRSDLPPLHYRDLVLACGAKVNALPFAHPLHIKSINNLMDYRHFREWLDGKKNKKQLSIIGSGLVGSEFTNDLVNANYALDIFLLDRYPLEKFVPEAIGQALKQQFLKKNIAWHGETLVNENLLQSMDGAICAIGLKPNITLANASGIACHRGIITNALLATNIENIYALGDCAEINGQVLQYIAPIMSCSKALAKTLTGNPTPVEFPLMPVVVKTPACPVTFLPLPQGENPAGQWHIEGKDQNIQAVYTNPNHQIQAFALSGEAVKQRQKLLQAMQSKVTV